MLLTCYSHDFSRGICKGNGGLNVNHQAPCYSVVNVWYLRCEAALLPAPVCVSGEDDAVVHAAATTLPELY